MFRVTQDFAPTFEDTRAALQDARARWEPLRAADPAQLPFSEVKAAHARIHAVAERISGTTLDARRRAVIYYAIYQDSAGNCMFPLIASHGSMWGVTHTVRIDNLLRPLRGLSRRGRIDRWMEALDAVRDINRRVFVEIYSTFYFTRYFGTHPRAGELVKPAVLELYNRMHAAVAAGELLPLSERRSIYYDIFVHEQNDIVDPGIHAAIEVAGSPYLVAVLKHVRPRFRYFPRGERLFFTDFTSIDQRNREGLRAMDFAELVGADRVLEALSEY